MKALLAGVLLLIGGSAHAQAPGDNLRINLLTFGPGDAVWERFGHNAIAVTDLATGQSIAYNWGMFSFDQPGYVRRLMKGLMLYWMEGFDTNAFIDAYVRQNRSIWVQQLNLTPEQRVAMRDFLAWNALEENRFYRYDYYRDNCSTRVQDAIDRVSGGALKRSLEGRPTNSTYRSHTQALTFSDPLTYTGLMLAMGPRIDEPLSAWEEGFIPMEVREWVRTVNVPDGNGGERPLVADERTIFDSGRAPIPDRAPSRVLPFTIVGCVIGLLLLLLARAARAPHARQIVVVTLAVAVGLLELLIGVFGTLITLLWAFTDHVVTYNNENVLQANTLSLVLAGLAPAALLARAGPRRWAAWLGLFVAGCSALGLLLQLLPQLDQANGEIIGLLLPIHAAIGYVLWRRWSVNLRDLGSAAPRAEP